MIGRGESDYRLEGLLKTEGCSSLQLTGGRV
jgi:hypothetical protein